MTDGNQPAMAPDLILGTDYVIEQGQWVFTSAYHLKRGYCCRNGCRYCPYDERRDLSDYELTAPTDLGAGNEQCSRCGAAFRCTPGKCWCDDLHVPMEALIAMQLQFEGCLCHDCLKAIVAHVGRQA